MADPRLRVRLSSLTVSMKVRLESLTVLSEGQAFQPDRFMVRLSS